MNTRSATVSLTTASSQTTFSSSAMIPPPKSVSSNIYGRNRHKNNNAVKTFTVPILCFIVIVIIFVNPMKSMVFAKTALNLCSSAILPTLFPFFVLSGLIINSSVPTAIGKYTGGIMRPLFGLSGSASIPFMLSMFAGAPVGAVMTCELYEQGLLSQEESERLICFTNNASPVFIVGSLCSGFLGLPQLGYLLFVIHLLAAITVGVLSKLFGRKFKKSDGRHFPSGPLSIHKSNQRITFQVFSNVLSSSITTVFYVCGCIVFFSVVSGPITSFVEIFFIELPSFAKAIITGSAEMTNGLHIICDSIKSYIVSVEAPHNISSLSFPFLLEKLPILASTLPIISFILGIGGLSVFVQVASVCSQHGIKTKKYLLAKITHGCLAYIFTKIIVISLTFF